MKLNINSKADMEQYKSTLFTDKGYETLTNYLKSLIIKYIQTNNYPTSLNPVLGLPIFEYITEIKHHTILLGRIQLLGQILGIKKVNFITENSQKVNFEMTGNYSIK